MLAQVLEFLISYIALYLLLIAVVTPPHHLSTKEKRMFIIHIPNFIGTFISVACSLYVHLSSNGANYSIPVSPETHMLICHLIGYLLCDLIFAIFYSAAPPSIYFHHLIAIIIFVWLAFFDSSSSAVVLLLFAESTNKSYQLRGLLCFLNLNTSKFARLNELVFSIAFVFNRLVLFWIMLVNSWIIAGWNNPVLEMLFVMGYWLGVYWSYQRVARNYLGLKVDLKQKNWFRLTALVILVVWSIVVPNFIITFYGIKEFHLKIFNFNLV